MLRYFTQYWSNSTWDREKEMAQTEPIFRHTAGELFRARGVKRGDIVYGITVRRGTLFVAGKIEVGKICGKAEAAASLGSDDLWEASEHIVASAGTRKNFELAVSPEITEQLLFVGSDGSKSLKFKAPGVLDQQTLRGVRELEPRSAALLDQTLPGLKSLDSKGTRERADKPMEPFPEGVVDSADYFEGSRKNVAVNVYERNAKARESCIAHYGLDCFICGFNFKMVYGHDGEGFIHVHHLKPLSEIRSGYRLNPVKDLRPVCPNCHAMIHKRIPAYTIEEMKRLIDRAAQTKTRSSC